MRLNMSPQCILGQGRVGLTCPSWDRPSLPATCAEANVGSGSNARPSVPGCDEQRGEHDHAEQKITPRTTPAIRSNVYADGLLVGRSSLLKLGELPGGVGRSLMSDS